MEKLIKIAESGYYDEDRTEYILSNGDKLIVWNDGELYWSMGSLSFDEYEEILSNYGITLKP